MSSFVALLLLSAPRETAYDREIIEAVKAVEVVFPVPTPLVKAIIKRESDFDPSAVSKAGAIGLMQIMPQNAERLGVSPEELFNPGKNILTGVRLVAVLLRHYRGDLISTLVAYNARPRELFAPLPDNGETPRYVLAVLRYYDDYMSPRLYASAMRTQHELRVCPGRHVQRRGGEVADGKVANAPSRQ